MSRKPSGYPCWAYPSKRAFKAQKRRDAKEAERAVRKLLFAAAFTPMKDVGVMLKDLREIRRVLGVKEWGR